MVTARRMADVPRERICAIVLFSVYGRSLQRQRSVTVRRKVYRRVYTLRFLRKRRYFLRMNFISERTQRGW